MQSEVFQKVFDILQPMLKDDWKKLIFFVGYTDDSYTMKYYTSSSEGEFSDCFSENVSNRSQLIKMFMNINKLLETIRDKNDDKNKWSTMTMVVNSDGTTKTEFDYTEIRENLIEYEHAWEERYIK